MTAKSYLEQYRHLDNEIKIKQEQLSRLRELAESVSPFGSGISSGETSDKVGRTAAKLVDAENEIKEMINRLVALKNDIEKIIESVENAKLRQILTLRYINGRTFEKIAEEMGYSYMQIYRLHEKALEKVKNVIECYICLVV